MSFKLMQWAVDNGPNDRTERLVLIVLARFCDKDRLCWPSIETIAEKAAMSERGAQKAITRLVENGWVEREVGGGKGRSSRYLLVENPAPYPEPHSVNEEANSPNPEPHSVNARPHTPNPATQTPNGSAQTPNPVHPNRSGIGQEEIEEVSMVQAKKKPPASMPIGWEQHFDDFWQAYPHRGGLKRKRKDAEAAFRKAIKAGVDIAQIALGVSEMRRDPNVLRGYARDPTSWLNQEGWTDEIPQLAGEPHDRNRTNSPANSGRRFDPHRGQNDAFAQVALDRQAAAQRAGSGG